MTNISQTSGRSSYSTMETRIHVGLVRNKDHTSSHVPPIDCARLLFDFATMKSVDLALTLSRALGEGCTFRPSGQAPAASSINTGFKGPTATTQYKDLVRRDKPPIRPVSILDWTSGHCIPPKYKDLDNRSCREITWSWMKRLITQLKIHWLDNVPAADVDCLSFYARS